MLNRINPDPWPQEPFDIAMIGQPGVGKTTIGEMVAENLGWEYVDMGDLVTSWVYLSTGEAVGEPEAQQENRILKDIGRPGKSRILSMGGTSTISRENRIIFMERFDRVFRLTCEAGEAADRRYKQLGGGFSRELYLEGIVRERTLRGDYDVGYPIDTTGRAPGDIADEIVKHITDLTGLLKLPIRDL